MKKRIIAMFLACFIGVTAVFGTAVKTKAFVVTATVSAIEKMCIRDRSHRTGLSGNRKREKSPKKLAKSIGIPGNS